MIILLLRWGWGKKLRVPGESGSPASKTDSQDLLSDLEKLYSHL